jgi:hypothetical protein
VKTLPELLDIAKERLATEEDCLIAWKADAQRDADWALLRAEYAVGYIEHGKAWREVASALINDDTVDEVLERAQRRVRQAMAREVRNVDILESTRVLSRVTAWLNVVNAIVEP